MTDRVTSRNYGHIHIFTIWDGNPESEGGPYAMDDGEGGLCLIDVHPPVETGGDPGGDPVVNARKDEFREITEAEEFNPLCPSWVTNDGVTYERELVGAYRKKLGIQDAEYELGVAAESEGIDLYGCDFWWGIWGISGDTITIRALADDYPYDLVNALYSAGWVEITE